MEEKEKSYQDQFNALAKEIKALKEEVIGEANEIETKAKAVAEDKEDWSKLSVSEKFRRRMVAKAQNENL
jgi:vacuolar-type H+-ATPase subunit E/Vma4